MPVSLYERIKSQENVAKADGLLSITPDDFDLILSALKGQEWKPGLPVSAEYLFSLIQRVTECEVRHDENGHAFIKVPARSMFDLGAVLGNVVRDETNRNAFLPTPPEGVSL